MLIPTSNMKLHHAKLAPNIKKESKGFPSRNSHLQLISNCLLSSSVKTGSIGLLLLLLLFLSVHALMNSAIALT